MKITFWGVRGSIPTPGPSTAKYGGNTACIEVRNNANEMIIIDAGSGLRCLGMKLLSEKRQIETAILLSHTHWDHIQGIPFFIPIYIPGNIFHIYGPKGTKRNLSEIFNIQMDHDFFPLNFNGLPSTNYFKQLDEETFEFKSFTISTKILNHGGLGAVLGYKITSDDKTIVYASDHEGYALMFKSGSDKTQKLIDGMEAKYRNFLFDADLLIHDAQYDDEDYKTKRGWGHSSIEYAVNSALSANIKKIALIHYDPNYNDERIDNILQKTKNKLIADDITDFEVIGSYEGLTLEI